MASDPAQQVKLILVAMAKYLRTEISRTQVKLYSRVLADLGSEGMQRAFAQMMADPDIKPGAMPLPGKIREYAEGSIDDEADRIAMRIMKARGKFSASEAEQAQAYIGDAGWEIVRGYGWPTLCNMQVGQAPTFMAQIRGIARAAVSLQRRARAGEAMLTHGGGKILALEGILGGEIDVEKGDDAAQAPAWDNAAAHRAGKDG